MGKESVAQQCRVDWKSRVSDNEFLRYAWGSRDRGVSAKVAECSVLSSPLGECRSLLPPLRRPVLTYSGLQQFRLEFV